MSFIGALAILITLPFKGHVHVYHGRVYAVWDFVKDAGFELGCFFIIGPGCESCNAHETGHGLQNCLWGPLMFFVITGPSIFRFWYREIKYYRKGKVPPTAYDDIWFEDQATRWGQKFVETDIL